MPEVQASISKCCTRTLSGAFQACIPAVRLKPALKLRAPALLQQADDASYACSACFGNPDWEVHMTLQGHCSMHVLLQRHTRGSRLNYCSGIDKLCQMLDQQRQAFGLFLGLRLYMCQQKTVLGRLPASAPPRLRRNIQRAANMTHP